ncbi:hypothetical protein ABPG72_002128 [Tetrahymena utriculariae]
MASSQQNYSYESSQVKINLQIMEEDFNSLLIKIQSSMNKMSSNNIALSQLLKQSATEYCEEVIKAKNLLQSIIADCENIQDYFIHIEILQKKIGHFRLIVEEIAKIKERELIEVELDNKQ